VLILNSILQGRRTVGKHSYGYHLHLCLYANIQAVVVLTIYDYRPCDQQVLGLGTLCYGLQSRDDAEQVICLYESMISLDKFRNVHLGAPF
jgi:hypothetical protein